MTEDSHNLSWEDDDEPAVCLAPKIADLSKDRHAPTSRLLATAQV